jgi:hypothetical protein
MGWLYTPRRAWRIGKLKRAGFALRQLQERQAAREQFGEIGGGHGPCHQEALRFVDAEIRRKFHISCVSTLRRRSETEFSRQPHAGFDTGARERFPERIAREGLVDLELGERIHLQPVDVRIAGAEIVDRRPNPLMRMREDFESFRPVFDQARLSHFQRHRETGMPAASTAAAITSRKSSRLSDTGEMLIETGSGLPLMTKERRAGPQCGS